MSNLKVYEVGVPVQETLIMQVVARSKREAWRIARAGGGVQICTVGGNARGGRDVVKELGPASELDSDGSIEDESEVVQ